MKSGISHVSYRTRLILCLLLFSPTFHVSGGPKVADCRINYPAAIKSQENSKAVFIDTRSPDQYKQSHIRGSVNLTTYKIKAKPYLKSKNLILIGKGPELLYLYRTCIDLRKAGFQHVHVLDNGLYGWVRNGGVLVPKLSSARLNYISAEELIRGAGYREYELINMSSAQPPSSIKQYVRNIKTVNSPQNIAGILNGLDGQKVILAVNDNKLLPRLEKEIENTKNIQIVYLDGGLAAYQRYYATYRAKLAKDSFKLQGLQSCTN